jgi:hypothetical protein
VKSRHVQCGMSAIVTKYLMLSLETMLSRTPNPEYGMAVSPNT